MLEAHSGDDGLVGKVARSMTEAPEGMYVVSPGTFTNVKPPAVRLAEVQARAMLLYRKLLGGRPRSALGDGAAEDDDISLPRYLGYSDAAARSVTEAATPADRDLRLLDYFKIRKSMGEVIHRFFGDPGLQVAAARYVAPEHQAAIALLRERLTDPGFASALSPSGAGGTRASRRSSAGLRLLHRPAGAKEGLNGALLATPIKAWRRPTLSYRQ